MINPCVKCPERDRCEGMNQPCKQGKAEMESRLQESGGAYEKGEQEEEVNYESRIQNIRTNAYRREDKPSGI